MGGVSTFMNRLAVSAAIGALLFITGFSQMTATIPAAVYTAGDPQAKSLLKPRRSHNRPRQLLVPAVLLVLAVVALTTGCSATAAPGYSTNWAGYVSPTGKFTAVSGSWTVPTATGNRSNESADAAWIGIGGNADVNLIQVGTGNDVPQGGQASYDAFYELGQADPTTLTMTVGPGDKMSAEIHQVKGAQWLVRLVDKTRHEQFATNVRYTSSESSAEWIEEDPSYPSGKLMAFDTFGSVGFTGVTVTEDGVTQTLAQAEAQAIVMINGANTPIATPSGIGADGQSFIVTGAKRLCAFRFPDVLA
jgi:Peptidase A4 family